MCGVRLYLSMCVAFKSLSQNACGGGQMLVMFKSLSQRVCDVQVSVSTCVWWLSDAGGVQGSVSTCV